MGFAVFYPPQSLSLFMKNFVGVCLILFCAAGAARAQVSYPGLLESRFDDTRTLSGLASTLLQSHPETLAEPGIVWQGSDELTVHTNKSREGLLEDAHANGSFAALRVALRKSPNAPQLVLSQRTLAAGLVDNEGGKAFHLSGNLRQPEARLLLSLRHHGLTYLGCRETTYNASGTTTLYNNLFTIFPKTPPFRYEGRERMVLAGLRLPLSPAWTAEGIVGYNAEPSRVVLHQDGTSTQIMLPFNASGLTALLAVRRRLTARSNLLAYLSGESLRGTAAVQRESSRSIGSADTTHRESGGGLGWQQTLGERRTFGVFLETARDRWQTSGFVPDPGDLQTNYPLTSDLHYAAGYTLRKDTLGIRWTQTASGRQEFQGNIQLIQASLHGEADYAVRLFGLPKSGQTTYRADHLRVLLLRGEYTLPWRRFRFGLEASQLIPLGSGSSGSGGGSSGGGAASADHRTTSGGWALSVRIERLF